MPLVQNNPTPTTQIPTYFEPIAKKNRPSYKKILIGAIIFLGIFFLCLILTFLTRFDAMLFGLKLEGTVLSENSPIANATITLKDDTFTTNDAGKFSISNLKPGRINLNIQADGYKSQDFEVSIAGGFFQYTTKTELNLERNAESTIEGKLVPDTLDYNFFEDRIYIADKAYLINNDGSFKLANQPSGRLEITFKSHNFQDFTKTFDLQKGSNILEPIVLTPSGDVTGSLVSFLNETFVENPEILVNNVTQNQIFIDKDKKQFVVSDLDIGKEYTVRTNVEGYSVTDFNIIIKRGENKLFGYQLIENEIAIYTLEDEDKAAGEQIVNSDINGGNLEFITNIDNLDPLNTLYQKENSKVFFQSDYERQQASIGSQAENIYSLNLTDKKITRISNLSSPGEISTNYISNKLLNLRKSSDEKLILEIASLDGTGLKQLKSFDDKTKIKKLLLSDDGNFVFANFTLPDKSEKFLRIDAKTLDERTVSDRKSIFLNDSESNGEKVLYTAVDESLGITDLFLTDFATGQTTKIVSNTRGFYFQFLDSENILYFENRNSKFNIYQFNYKDNKETQLTNLSSDAIITEIYLQNRNLYYELKNQGLYILNPENPKNNKLVIKKSDD